MRIMRNIRKLAASVCFIAAAFNPVYAGQEDDQGRAAFEALVKANTHEITFENNKLGGEGLQWLLEEGAKAQYFMVGERHGLAEIPEVSAQLYEGLVDRGYSYAALEFGPFAAMKAEEALNKGGYEALSDYLSSKEGYYSIAFLDWVEEAKMAARMHAASPIKEGAIWGLDQEFGPAAYSHFLHLEKLAKGDALQSKIIELQKAALSDEFYLANVPEEALKGLRSDFEVEGSTEAMALLDDMLISRHIYGPWAKPRRLHGSASNIIREDYISSNFVKEVMKAREKTGKDPKVFFKFGGGHSAPTIDLKNGRFLLGMMVEYFAKIGGKTAFNILIDCSSGGNQSSGQDAVGKGQELSCNSMFGEIAKEGEDMTGKNIFSKVLAEKEKSGSILLIDFRPIRMSLYSYKFLTDEERGELSGFDAYMTIPNTHPSTSFTSPFKKEKD